MTAIIVALIGAVVTLLVEVARRQNKSDHARGYSLLQSIDSRLMHVDEKLDDHIANPAAHNPKELAP